MADRGSAPARGELELVFPDCHAHHRRADLDRRRGLSGQCRNPHQVDDRPHSDHVLIFVPEERQQRVRRRPSVFTGTRFRCRSNGSTSLSDDDVPPRPLTRRTCRCRSSACVTTTISRTTGPRESAVRSSRSSSDRRGHARSQAVRSTTCAPMPNTASAAAMGQDSRIDAFKLEDRGRQAALGLASYKYDYWGPQLYLTARF